MKLTGATRLQLEGRGAVTVSPSDHMTTGGEAVVYRIGNTIIKLPKDPTAMARDGKVAKIGYLSQLNHPFIVAPRGVVLDGHSKPVGLYMDYAQGEPLARVFTNSFRKRQPGFGDAEASVLVDGMFQVLAFAHGYNLLMVDPNELNWVAARRTGRILDPRAFDVDPWIVGNTLPASVPMMPSIRDWHTKRISPETDRFALAVVTFQVYTGIHPYKGMLAGYQPSDLERRMQDRASIFTPGVRLNQAVRDPGCIPGPLLGWYQAVFEDGDRSAPPSPFDTGVTTPARTVRVGRIVTTAQSTLRYERLYDGQDQAVRVFPCGVVQLQSGGLYDLAKKRLISQISTNTCEVIQADGDWVVASFEDGKLSCWHISGTSFQSQPLSVDFAVQGVMRAGNRLFAITDQGLSELRLMRFQKPILTRGQTWGIMPKSTQWFDGMGVMDAMGATFLIAPFGDNACAQVRVRELDGLHVVTAKAGNRFVSVIALDSQGQYRKVEFTFDRQYTAYSTWQGTADGPELNIALLPRGVATTIVRDGELVIFVPTQGTLNKVADKDVTTDMLLGNWSDRVVYIRDGQVWQVSTS